MTGWLLDTLDHGWVWTLLVIAALVVLVTTVEQWDRVRHWRCVDALLVAAAIADHFISGSEPRGRHEFSTPIDERPWSLAPPERLLWLVEDVELDTYEMGA